MSRLKSMFEERKLIWPVLFGTLIIVVGVWAANAPQSGRDSFFEGNQAYSQGRYQDAIAHYRAALQSEGVSASLLFNLANAYQRQGNSGQAILNYERALAIDPANADIRANLQGLRNNLGLYREETPLWVRFFETLSLNAWTLLASGAFFAIGLLFLIRGVLPFVRKQREAGRPLGFLPFKTVIALLFVMMTVSLTGVWAQFQSLNRAVVTEPDARLLISPFESAEAITPVKEGRLVEILKTFGDFSFVREANGQTGWIPKKSVQPIVPRAAWTESEPGKDIAHDASSSSMVPQLAAGRQG